MNVATSAIRAGLDFSAPSVVFGKDAAQVAFAEDEHPVGDLGPGGELEPLGIGVRAGLRGRIFAASIRVLTRTPSGL